MSNPVIFPDFKILMAKQLKSVISNTQASIYFTFGKVDDWANNLNPPIANTAEITVHEVWGNMIGGKRLTGGDVSHVIPRYNWGSGNTYISYDDTVQLSNTNFFVVTDDRRVYKCISNNKSSISTSKPTSIVVDNISQTSDGYKWKFMYEIDSSDWSKYSTSNYIPVKTLSNDNGSLQWQVQRAAVTGSIYDIQVTATGANYSNTSNLVVNIGGDGTGAIATANINSISKGIHTITLIAFGSQYSQAPVTISGGGGFGASARAIIAPGGGHGIDPVTELYGSHLAINPRLINAEGGILPVVNEFRQISIINNPLVLNTPNVASNSVFSQTLDVTVSGTGGDYLRDEIVYQGDTQANSTFIARVLDWDSSNTKLKLINTLGTISTKPLFGVTSAASRFVTINPKLPDLTSYTGDVLYVENITPVTRDPNQTEDFKIIINF